ncbi:MAG TPA: 4-(cytidine 5'-diphospho)-2-C-methyl-D-erythritol kinase [Candidatus Krumholzibacterium sp.]|nr:4-(cytidine 5'-diphospho)-2-C-methyl-D-erythritol kinase [Candidatus Krumholzibacterium sp.]
MDPEKRIAIRCSAKINLLLAVTGRREDGFHDILTLFQPVSLFDEIRLSTRESGIHLTGDDPSIDWDATNLCHRAASLILDASGCREGVAIEVRKGIPHGAGLGGGSSDAAGVIFGLNALLGLGRTAGELAAVGLEAGSDVPFFLGAGPAVGRGRGEILEPAKGLDEGWLLIVKPPLTISTVWAYDNIKYMLTRSEGEDRLNCLLKGLKDLPDKRVETYNSFENIAVKEYPEIGEILKILRNGEAVLSSLSGSGAACFALFDTEERAKRVEKIFTDETYFTCIARPWRKALKVIRWE